MFSSARAMPHAGLGDPDGTDDSAEMRVQIFLRTYGGDFTPEARDRIVAKLRAAGEAETLAHVRRADGCKYGNMGG